MYIFSDVGIPGDSVVKNLPVNSGYARYGFESWVIRKIPWGRMWHLTKVFLPGKSNGQRSLVGYSPWGPQRDRHDLAMEHACMFSNCCATEDS